MLTATVLVHFAPLDNALDNDDAWNYVLESDRFLAGGGSSWVEGGSYFAHQNVQRLLVSLTWILRWALFGLWMPGWHLPGIVFHGLNAWLLGVALAKLGASRPAALTGAALWGLSPLHPFTVAWIGGNYDVFAGTFSLGALILFLDRRTLPAVVLTLGALLSKETGVLLVAVLGVIWLLYERDQGLRAGFRRLLPYAGITGLVLLARIAQIQYGGSIDQAGLPARTIGLSPQSLGYVGPTALLAGLGLPLRSVLAMGLLPSVGVVVGLLAAGLAWYRRAVSWRFIGAGMVGAWLLLVPILLMREEGLAMGVEEILHHARYLYLPAMLMCGVLATALVGGARPHRGGLALAMVLIGLSAFASVKDVARLTQIEPPAATVAETLLAADLPDGGDVWVLTNIVDQGSYRLLMSRWLQWKTGARFHFVQRGWWRVLERKQELPFGLDFKDYYVRAAKEAFSPALVGPRDVVYWLRYAGSQGGHALEKVELPRRDPPQAGKASPLSLKWKPTNSGRAGGATIRDTGIVEFNVAVPANESPVDYRHQPIIVSNEVWLSTRRVWGLRLTYVATGAAVRAPDESDYSRGYAELHWTAEGVRASDSYVVLPLILDGREHHVDVPLWFDPAWRAKPQVARLGFVPYDLSAEVILRQVSVIKEAR